MYSTSPAAFPLYDYRGSTTEAYAAEYGHNFGALEETSLIGDNSVDIADAILLFMHSMLPEEYPLF